MRIATFNILHGRSLDDGRVDVDRLAAAVKTLDADVLGLQEVDRDQPRSLGADLTAVAAEAMGAVDSQFVAALSGTPGGTWMAATGEEQPGSASYGIALLSRYPVVSWRVVRLPALRASVPLWSPQSRRPFLARDEPRVAVAAVLDGPHGQFTVCNTHLSFIPGWNGSQLRRLVSSLAGTREPLVLMGDLNMERRKAARTSGLTPIASVPTFPAGRPARQLDHVLVRGPVSATGPAEAVRLPLSDHRALVVPATLGW
ncbi:endonuclease/exonuclease/phosphatase family protein [Blastococcus sp. TML/M2B]|uniref:endonuclease/exonuclease/phosphatase family protein n=1 Tax=unclassified Blastococcus TaxID=2619396 RepID=UPI00190AC36D|nr:MULTISPECIES: endonuclease/exonuclease/phosphatase family protein [unclassified Blastococcus]MBN1091477.1 endonuclease/exonuclease/phosphatase family protein [Blastococcus sp. TML/M2B]MBN1094969.1 endonuclease/exonuclease/phosphatase family protein [Blastococcus sp. TML/C7B]